jgi:HK97 family phage major capsid protein
VLFLWALTQRGGYTVPQGFYDQLIEAMKWFGGMRPVANVFSTDSGNALPIPTTNDTSNVGEILAEKHCSV